MGELLEPDHDVDQLAAFVELLVLDGLDVGEGPVGQVLRRGFLRSGAGPVT